MDEQPCEWKVNGSEYVALPPPQKAECTYHGLKITAQDDGSWSVAGFLAGLPVASYHWEFSRIRGRLHDAQEAARAAAEILELAGVTEQALSKPIERSA